METQTFVYIVEHCSQDASTVIGIIEHVLRTLKEDSADVAEAFVRQDNAGCYHDSAITLGACCLMEQNTGVRVASADFNDPQSGKGPCDGKATSIKAHIRRFINEGHDVTAAQQFRHAILSSGGVSGVRVVIVGLLPWKTTPLKLAVISLQKHLEFSNRQITAWRAYNIVSGKVIREQDLQGIYISP